LAEWCGLLHDYGKYTDCFQEMITEGEGKCPHAIHGAVMAFSGSATDPIGLRAPHIASAIAGHHAGMPDLGELRDKALSDKAKAIRIEAFGLLQRASLDLPILGKLFDAPPPKLENPGIRFDLLTRMLLSCLVDADRLDTAGREVVQAPLHAADRLNILLAHLNQLAGNSPEGVVKNARREVLDNCLRAASLPEKILSLSVPTGGGKTLSAMSFALKRAALQPERYRRIILVIPYLSIIEQNAEVYTNIFGADSILEHHSGSFNRLTRQDEDHFKLAPDAAEQYQRPS
jgi:CRISPR-associated endonuclease/helicase Cas3